MVLRALCRPRPGELRVLGEDEPFWEPCAPGVRRRHGTDRSPARAEGWMGVRPVDRRGEGFAGVAVDLLTSGESMVAAVADVARRRGLACRRGGRGVPRGHGAGVLAGAGSPPRPGGRVRAPGGDRPASRRHGRPPARSRPARAPRLGPRRDRLRATGVARRARPEARARRRLPSPPPTRANAPATAIEQALRGSGAYPRSPECCGRLLRILDELGLVELDLDLDEPRRRPREGVRTDLELSAAYRAYRDRLRAAERALGVREPAETAQPAMRQAS